eukprot:COSAG02_NODE_2055_length_9982_cov_3.771426_2_plen_146_part_00
MQQRATDTEHITQRVLHHHRTQLRARAARACCHRGHATAPPRHCAGRRVGDLGSCTSSSIGKGRCSSKSVAENSSPVVAAVVLAAHRWQQHHRPNINDSTVAYRDASTIIMIAAGSGWCQRPRDHATSLDSRGRAVSQSVHCPVT